MKTLSLSLLSLAAFTSFATADIWTDLAQYKMGDNADAAPWAVHELILNTAPDQFGPIEDQLMAVLQSPSATHEAKEYSFRMLDRIGSDRSVPTVAKFLADEKLALFARRSLEFRKDSKLAGEALVRALPQLPDDLKVGVIGSLGRRGDVSVVSVIAPYASNENVALAKASLFALGQLGGDPAHTAIMGATVTRDTSDSRAEALLAAAALIKDPGTYYALGRSVEPVGGSYVQSDAEDGWKGEYFNNRDFSGAPDFVRQDNAPYFDWGQGSPTDEIGKNDFTVRWTGVLTPPETRAYEFNVDSDDGVQFNINGEAIFDHLGGGYKGTASKELEAGVSYQVEVKFVEGGGDARCQLTWDCALPETIAACRQKILNVPIAQQQAAVLSAKSGVDVKTAQQIFENGANPSIRLDAFNQLAALDLNVAKAALNATLSNASDPIRQSLIRAAMELGDAALQDQLVGTLASASELDQLTLLGAILDLRLSQYESAVLPLLSSSEGIVFDQAVYTLGYVGADASFKPLYEAFQTEENPAITFAITQLQLPAVDQHLLKLVSGQSGSDLESRLSAITPLVLRNPDGASAVMDSLVAAGQAEALRKAGFTGIETIGNVESCKVLADLIVANDSMKRQAQQTLKKTALRLDKGHDVWNAAFKPTLTSGSADQATKEDFMVIVDGVPTGDSMKFIKKTVLNPSDPLLPLALRALQKWPSPDAGNVWIEIANAPTATAKEQALAVKGIARILTRDEIEKDSNRRLRLALKAVQEGPTLEFKLGVLSSLKDCDNHTRDRMNEHFKSIKNDPEVGAAVQALMKRN
jgi:HEAT repeat protein